MSPGRKVPFSGRAKKEQLKLKRQRKRVEVKGEKAGLALLQNYSKYDTEDDCDDTCNIMKINAQPNTASRRDKNRYVLQFQKESKEELESRKKDAFKTLKMCKEVDLEIILDDYFPCGLDLPKRPPWNFRMNKEELDTNEHRYFREYINNLERQFGHKKLSYFELNLETWRQFWRVTEMSDIILMITDVRYSVFMFPPYLYHFICDELKKDMILILNKIDLVPADLVVAWKYYFLKHYPAIKIITFTSFPSYNLRNDLLKNETG